MLWFSPEPKNKVQTWPLVYLTKVQFKVQKWVELDLNCCQTRPRFSPKLLNRTGPGFQVWKFVWTRPNQTAPSLQPPLSASLNKLYFGTFICSDVALHLLVLLKFNSVQFFSKICKLQTQPKVSSAFKAKPWTKPVWTCSWGFSLCSEWAHTLDLYMLLQDIESHLSSMQLVASSHWCENT